MRGKSTATPSNKYSHEIKNQTLKKEQISGPSKSPPRMTDRCEAILSPPTRA